MKRFAPPPPRRCCDVSSPDTTRPRRLKSFASLWTAPNVSRLFGFCAPYWTKPETKDAVSLKRSPPVMIFWVNVPVPTWFWRMPDHDKSMKACHEMNAGRRAFARALVPGLVAGFLLTFPQTAPAHLQNTHQTIVDFAAQNA